MASIVRDGNLYRCGDWQVTIEGEGPAIFWDELVWAGQAVIGRDDALYFLELSTGKLLHKMEVRGYFARLEAWEERLFVSGMRDLHCFVPPREQLWCARDLAVDGALFCRVEGGIVHARAEMDPPGGWFAVELDLATGRELRRTEDFADDYHGWYGPPRQ